MRGMRGQHTARGAGGGPARPLGAAHAVRAAHAAPVARAAPFAPAAHAAPFAPAACPPPHAHLHHPAPHPGTSNLEYMENAELFDKLFKWNMDVDNIPLHQLLGNRNNPGMPASGSAGMSAAAIAQNQRPQMNLPAAPPLSNQHTASSVPAQGAAAPHTGVGALVQWQPCASSHLPARGGLQPARLGGAPSSPRGAATPSAPRTHPVFMGQRPPARSSHSPPHNIPSPVMQQPSQAPASDGPHPKELWYYEDAHNKIQGPFTSDEMYFWYVSGFFKQSMMIRRASDSHMSPLRSYGPHPFKSVFKCLWVFSNGNAGHLQHASVPPINLMTPITNPFDHIPDRLRLPEHLSYLRNNLDEMHRLIIAFKFTYLRESLAKRIQQYQMSEEN